MSDTDQTGPDITFAMERAMEVSGQDRETVAMILCEFISKMPAGWHMTRTREEIVSAIVEAMNGGA